MQNAKTIYGLYDNRANCYVDYVITNHEADVVRQMTYVANNKGTVLNLYASDFSVRVLAYIDDETGLVVPTPELDRESDLFRIADLVRDIDVEEGELDAEISH